MNELAQLVTNNVGAIAAFSLCIWYMTKRDKLMQDTFTMFSTQIKELGEKMGELGEALTAIQREMERDRPRK